MCFVRFINMFHMPRLLLFFAVRRFVFSEAAALVAPKCLNSTWIGIRHVKTQFSQMDLYLAKSKYLGHFGGSCRGQIVANCFTAQTPNLQSSIGSDDHLRKALQRTLASAVVISAMWKSDSDKSTQSSSFCVRVLAAISGCAQVGAAKKPFLTDYVAKSPERLAAASFAVTVLGAAALLLPDMRGRAMTETGDAANTTFAVSRAYCLAHLLGTGSFINGASHMYTRAAEHCKTSRAASRATSRGIVCEGNAHCDTSKTQTLSLPYTPSHGTVSMLPHSTNSRIGLCRGGDAAAFLHHNALAPSLRAQRLHQLRRMVYRGGYMCKLSSCTLYGDVEGMLRRRPLRLSPCSLHRCLCALYDSAIWGNMTQGMQLYRARDSSRQQLHDHHV